MVTKGEVCIIFILYNLLAPTANLKVKFMLGTILSQEHKQLFAEGLRGIVIVECLYVENCRNILAVYPQSHRCLDIS